MAFTNLIFWFQHPLNHSLTNPKFLSTSLTQQFNEKINNAWRGRKHPNITKKKVMSLLPHVDSQFYGQTDNLLSVPSWVVEQIKSIGNSTITSFVQRRILQQKWATTHQTMDSVKVLEDHHQFSVDLLITNAKSRQ